MKCPRTDISPIDYDIWVW